MEEKHSNRLLIIIIIALVIWNIFLTVSLADRRPNNPNQQENVTNVSVTGFSTDLSNVVASCSDATVAISSGSNISSGFIFRSLEDRFYVVTTYHTIVDDKATVLLDNFTKLEATVKGHDLYSDIAVLEVMSNYEVETVKLGDSDLLKAGEFVILLGTSNNFEYANIPEVAMVANPLKTINNVFSHEGSTHTNYLCCIQLSNNLQSTYSGSGVFNMNGELVGIATNKSSPNESNALTINELKKIAEDIISDGVVSKRLLGIKGTYVSSMPSYLKSNLGINIEQLNGLYVENVLANSLANVFGINNGDLIVSINGKTITDFSSYLDVIYSKDSEYDFEIVRNGENISIKEVVND